MSGPRIINLKEIVGELEFDQFKDKFNSHEECLAILAEAKWKSGFVCRLCGNERYCQGRTLHSRRCTRCKRDESATAHTVFHHCRMDLPKAFEIAYLVCGKPSMPASEISIVMDTRHMTCLNFKKRILHCLHTEVSFISDTRSI